jgi:hypothetical protein
MADLLFVPGKRYIWLLCTALSVLGIIALIEGGFVIKYSNGMLSGGWYLGIVNLLTALRSLYLFTSLSVRWLLNWSVLSFVVGIVSAVISFAEYNSVDNLQACVRYNGNSLSLSCGVSSNFTCYGNHNYFDSAITCEESFLASKSDDNYYKNNQCDCIYSGGRCESFLYSSNCGNILDRLPQSCFVSLIISSISVFFSFFLVICCTLVLCKPTFFMSETEINQRQELLQSAIAENTAVSTTATFVQTVIAVNPIHSENDHQTNAASDREDDLENKGPSEDQASDSEEEDNDEEVVIVNGENVRVITRTSKRSKHHSKPSNNNTNNNATTTTSSITEDPSSLSLSHLRQQSDSQLFEVSESATNSIQWSGIILEALPVRVVPVAATVTSTMAEFPSPTVIALNDDSVTTTTTTTTTTDV